MAGELVVLGDAALAGTELLREQAGVGEIELGRVQLSGAQAGTPGWDDVDEEDRAQKLDVGADRYEAALKCHGVGLGACDAQRSGERDLWIAELDGGPRGAAAVAAEQPPRELHCWDFLGDP